MSYRVVKTLKGRRYVYDQETYRHRGKVKTRSRYIGPVEVVGDPSFPKRVLSFLRSPRRDDDKGLEWAMKMVARLTGRSVEQQLAEMEAHYATARDAPKIAIAATFASAATQAAASPGAPSAASAPGGTPNGTSTTANDPATAEVAADDGAAASDADGDRGSGGAGDSSAGGK